MPLMRGDREGEGTAGAARVNRPRGSCMMRRASLVCAP
jgi:hypothetical protein